MSHDNQLEKIEERIRKLQAQKSAIKARERGRQRKRRTHALIVLGAAAATMMTKEFDHEDTKASLLALVPERDKPEVESLLRGALD